jgi:hypothetical protein
MRGHALVRRRLEELLLLDTVCADLCRRWCRDSKPRWFPPIVRVTEQGRPTDGSVKEFVSGLS